MEDHDKSSLIDTIGITRAAGLSRAPLDANLIRWAVALAAAAWVPSLLLSFVEGRALSGVQIPFLHDFAVAARALVVIPLLVLAPGYIRRVLRAMVAHLETSGIVSEADQGRYQRAKSEALKSRNSRLGEWLTAALALGLAIINVANPLLLPTDGWQSDPQGPAFGRSMAGLWNGLVAAPIFSYLVLAWWRRIAIWGRFLYRISKLDLQLVGSHPDRVGGLGFLAIGQAAFGLILFAFSLGFSARIGISVVFEHAELQSHIPGAVGLIVIEILAIGLPLMFFGPMLRRARRHAWLDYSRLAGRQSRAFVRHWMGERSPDDEELRSSPDVSTTTDMGGVFDIVAGMSPTIMLRRVAMALMGPSVGPFLPLVLTVVPLGELLKGIVSLLL